MIALCGGHLISTSLPDSVTPSGLPPNQSSTGWGQRPSSWTTSPCLSSYRIRASSSYFSPCRVAAFPVNFSPRPHFLSRSPSGVSYLLTPMAVAASEAVNILPRRASHSSDFCAAYSRSNAALTFGCMLT